MKDLRKFDDYLTHSRVLLNYGLNNTENFKIDVKFDYPDFQNKSFKKQDFIARINNDLSFHNLSQIDAIQELKSKISNGVPLDQAYLFRP